MNKYKLFLSIVTSCLLLQIQPILASQIDYEIEVIRDAATKIQGKLEYLHNQEQQLSQEALSLKSDITQADYLVGILLDPNTTPTTVNFLRAVYRKAPESELQALYSEAKNRKEIYDVIIGGHTKFRSSVPSAQESLLKLSGLMSNLKVTDDMATITYGKVDVKATPEKLLDGLSKITNEVSKRNHQKEYPESPSIPKIKAKTKPLSNDIPPPDLEKKD